MNNSRDFYSKIHNDIQKITKSKESTTKLLSEDTQNSMNSYLESRSKQNSVFCQFLITSSILTFFVSQDHANILKKKIFYYINAGPISRVMKFETASEENKLDEKYLLQNNFSLHTVKYPAGDDASKNVGFVYCRTCSDYILVQDLYKELPNSEVINDIANLDQTKRLSEDYNYRTYFNSDAYT